MIRRTVSSLASQHLFYKAELVVYCEGGPSKTVDEAIRNDQSARTLDGTYWSRVTSMIGVSKTLHFKSVGSKTTLRQIADDVISGGVVTVTICFDQDYDVLLSSFQASPRVATTYGYSWESDVLDGKVLPNILTHIVGTPTPSMLADLQTAITRLTRELKPWLDVDIALRSRKKKCVFDRERPTSSINFDVKPVSVAELKLKNRLETIGYKRKPRKVFVCNESDIMKVCFGKLVSHLVYHNVVFLASGLIGKTQLSYENFMRIAIAETFSMAGQGLLADFRQHHRNQQLAF